MLDAGGGGGAAIGSMMASFNQAATLKQFAVSPEGGQALISAIRELAEWVDGNLSEANYVAQELPLGSSNGAEVMKPYMLETFTDKQGFIAQLKAFRDSLADTEASILEAMKNYDSTEQTIQGNFRVV
jgi:hypothetical protein